GHKISLVNCTVQRISGDSITFSTSGTNVRANTTGTVTAILKYQVTTTNAGSYYLITAPVTIQVTSAAASYDDYHLSLLPSAAGFFRNTISNMNIDVTKNVDNSYTLRNTSGSWPAVDNKQFVSMTAKTTDRLYYDVTVGGSISILLNFSDGSSAQVQKAFTGSNTYSGDDLVGNGSRFTGSIALSTFVPSSAISSGSCTITGIRIFNVGSAGTDVVVHALDIVQDVLTSGTQAGDIDSNGSVDSTDARQIMLYVLRARSFTTLQESAADYDGNGLINSSDVRKILQDAVA
ncbi:MAG: dockerin type I repeat-containing protein, partial [Clostridia bacterium]|nr:dockerin type I repeat-containing protein [Clostridia bacterium]